MLRDRGHYYLNLGRTGPGLADLVQAVALSPRDRGVYYHLGLAYYLQGDFANAATAYDGCVANSGDETSRVECQAWLLPSRLRSRRAFPAATARGRRDHRAIVNRSPSSMTLKTMSPPAVMETGPAFSSCSPAITEMV